jgi:hypothetical protein
MLTAVLRNYICVHFIFNGEPWAYAAKTKNRLVDTLRRILDQELKWRHRLNTLNRLVFGLEVHGCAGLFPSPSFRRQTVNVNSGRQIYENGKDRDEALTFTNHQVSFVLMGLKNG